MGNKFLNFAYLDKSIRLNKQMTHNFYKQLFLMQLQLTFGKNKQFESSLFYAESVPQKGFLLVNIS